MSADCDLATTNDSKLTQSSVAALESTPDTSTSQIVLSPPPRPKTKSKSCGNSPKCTSREHSRPHSPVMWKKPSKNGSPVSELEREGGEEAPFGRESGGGSAYSSPFSERATPPYVRWAKSLEDLLDDYEGMELFKQYLAEQKESHLLDFWYACKGFKKLDKKESDRIQKVAENLHANYVASRGVHNLTCLSMTTRSAIHNRLFSAAVSLDQSMYDEAQKEVHAYLRDRHAQFVSSDTYILYLQDIQAGGWDSPKCYSHEVHSNNSSSSGEARRPSSTLLPTVHEDTEFESESERLTNLNSTASAAAASQVFSTAETVNANTGPWPNQAQASAKSLVSQKSVHDSTTLTGPSTGDETATGSVASGGVKRRSASSVASSGAGGQQTTRPAGSLLTRDSLSASFGQRLLATKPSVSRPGAPPNPYHAPYVPYLPTSAQDSELQSMSSDATTESGFSGANYQRKEQRIMQHHVENNRGVASNQITIPRIDRQERSRAGGQSTAQDMTDPDFCRKVKDILEKIRREQDTEQKLDESLKRLSEPETGHNDHRAAVNKFYNEEQNLRLQKEDDAEAILEDYCSRVPYFQDSPKQSPLRSPGLAGVGRRRSPIAKSPIRSMTTSLQYPMAASFSHTNSRMMADAAIFQMSQSAIQPSRSKSGHHSAGNTMHRAPKHEQFLPTAAVAAPPVDKRISGAIPKKPAPRYPPAASDTSGIYSGTSTEPSLVSARFTPNLGQRGAEHWIVDPRQTFENADNDVNRQKMRSGSSTNAAPNPGSTSESKSHRSSCHRSGDKSASIEKGRGQKLVQEGAVGQTYKNPLSHGRRSEPVNAHPSSSFGASASGGPAQDLSVAIFLPNETTPYVSRFQGRQITLKQFKQLVPRKGNYRYYFQCVSDELGTGFVHREVVDDHEILPFYDDNRVVAKIVAN